MSRKWNMKLATLVSPLMMILLVAACATSKQARKVEPSGFLKDYSVMHEGKKGEALLIYRNPDAKLSSYDKIIFENVTIWKGEGESRLQDASKEDLERLAVLLHSAIVQQLQPDYEVIDAPGPSTGDVGSGVMRLRVAITEATESKRAGDLMTTILPVGWVTSGIKTAFTGTPAFVGMASVEAELTDPHTDKLLIAAVDRRSGGKSLKGSTKSWDDVEASMAYWAERLARRLQEERM